MTWLHKLADAQAALSADRYADVLRHGTLRLALYAPVGEDGQSPHKQDELYIVASGRAGFVKAGERVEVAEHDVLFVEAGVEHRFVDMSEDFAAWVVFWGPAGGEVGG